MITLGNGIEALEYTIATLPHLEGPYKESVLLGSYTDQKVVVKKNACHFCNFCISPLYIDTLRVMLSTEPLVDTDMCLKCLEVQQDFAAIFLKC